MKLVYIAGKYRGKTHNEVFDNIMKAREWARYFWINGCAAICPHLNTAFMDGEKTDRMFLEGDKEILKRCDYIFLIEGWEESRGAKAEWKFAKEHKIPQITVDDIWAGNTRKSKK